MHTRLRDETRPRHDALESAVDVNAALASRAAYADYLLRLWRVHKAAERSLCALEFTAHGFDYRSRTRTPSLEADLRSIGYGDSIARAMPPHAPAWPSLHHALGAVYVVEGSALGARILLPDIKQRLSLDEQDGASFFIGFGAEGKPIWRACLAALAAIDATGPEADAVVDGANTMFAFFQEHLPPKKTAALEVAC